MKAARLYKPGEALVIEDVPVPEPKGEAVLIKIAGSGACHSDLHVIRGQIPIPPPLPRTLGHENAGYVEAYGELAKGLTIGQPVAVYGGWGCGVCRLCRNGQEQLCDVSKWGGLGPDGGYAEYYLVPSYKYLIPLDGLDPVESSVLTDAALTPYRAVKKVVPFLFGGSTAVLIGVGGLGQFGVLCTKLLTPARVVAVDIVESKLEIARALGADDCVDGRGDIAQEVKRLTGGEGAQAVLDIVGDEETLRTAAGCVARGGIIVVVGLGGGVLPFSLFGLPTETVVTTSQWGSYTELQEVIALAKQGKLPARVERCPLEAINEVFDRLERREVAGRVVITP